LTLDVVSTGFSYRSLPCCCLPFAGFSFVARSLFPT
jgi:hypothetical protein